MTFLNPTGEAIPPSIDSGEFVAGPPLAPAPAPSSVVGPRAWMREHLFGGVFNTVMTLALLGLFVWLAPPLIRFLFIDAVWSGANREACIITPERPVIGACWPFIWDRAAYFTYGSYPIAERWRVNLFFALLGIGVVWLLSLKAPRKDLAGLYFFIALPLLSVGLLLGPSPVAFMTGYWETIVAAAVVTAAIIGLFSKTTRSISVVALAAVALLYGFDALWTSLGLRLVETQLWGGILVTVVVSAVGIVVSLPLGIILALGRRSAMPAARFFSVLFIEFVRGVPLITVLFMASVMLPLFVPDAWQPDKLLRALIGVALFASAYMAEVVRAGLQALPKGQYEGAQSLGLTYWQMMGLVILPQALRVTIPNIVNTFIGLFKDTTLVVIVGIFDFLKTIEAARIDPQWGAPTVSTTGYIFAAIFYFICCFLMSRYARGVETRLARADKR